MMSATPRLRRLLAATFFATSVALALGYPAAAGAEPQQQKCPKNTVTIGNQGQVISPPAQNEICDDDQTGLLGGVPVLGSLGLGSLF
jgi:hypothetical protein